MHPELLLEEAFAAQQQNTPAAISQLTQVLFASENQSEKNGLDHETKAHTHQKE